MSDIRVFASQVVTTIPEGAQPGWSIRADYRSRSDLMSPGMLIARQEKLGVTVHYGMTPGGFDGFVIDQDRGGVVIVPFVEINDEICIGVVEQKRPLQDQRGLVLNVPRGFSDGGEFEDDARRELQEEMNLNPVRLIDLGGQPTNPNSAFFQTAGSKQGDRWFGVALLPDQVVQISGAWRLRPDLIVGNKAHKIAECIGRAQFIPIDEATGLGDMYTVAAAAKIQKLVKALKAS